MRENLPAYSPLEKSCTRRFSTVNRSEKPFSFTDLAASAASSGCSSTRVTCAISGCSRNKFIPTIPAPAQKSAAISPFFAPAKRDKRTASEVKR